MTYRCVQTGRYLWGEKRLKGLPIWGLSGEISIDRVGSPALGTDRFMGRFQVAELRWQGRKEGTGDEVKAGRRLRPEQWSERRGLGQKVEEELSEVSHKKNR